MLCVLDLAVGWVVVGASAMLDFGVVGLPGEASAMLDFGVGPVVGVGKLAGQSGLDSSCLVAGLDLG